VELGEEAGDLCLEHWAMLVFSIGEKKDMWFRVKICGFVTKK